MHARIPLAAGFLLLLLLGGRSPHPVPEASSPAYPLLRGIIAPEDFAALRPVHRDMLVRLARRIAGGDPLPAAVPCWSDDPGEAVTTAFDLLNSMSPTYQAAGRWTTTATDGSGLSQGDPTTLTWGFLPDGVSIPSGSGEPTAPSILIGRLDNQFGSGPGGSDLTQRPWFTYFDQAFTRWGELIGVEYVYEPNDDAAGFPYSSGVLGVRPDVRIGGHSIDGTAGQNTYAYNYFPNTGDMVIDTDNMGTFGNSAGNYVLLRNLIHHEHGHGIGLLHSCPMDYTKVMEAIIRTNFDGPQIDDILGGNRGYGDFYEFPDRNETYLDATGLGSFAYGDSLRVTNLSIDSDVDEDYFALTLPAQTRLYVTMQPTGSVTWDAVGSAGGCPYGPDVNSLIANNLGFDVYGTLGTNLLVSQSGTPVGNPEVLTNFLLTEGAGTYYLRVFSETGTDAAQMYDLDIYVSPGQAPVAQCRDVKICRNTLGANRVDNGSYDPDGDPITLSLDPPPPYAPGPNPVSLIADDGVLQDTCQAVVTVNRAPVAACKNITVEGDSTQECTAFDVIPGDVDDGTADPDGDAFSLSLDPPGPYALGSHQVLLIAEDICGVADTCTTTVTVVCPGLVAVPGEEIARGFRLGAAAPNPFRAGTTISFRLEEPSPVELAVYDARGRRVRTVLSGYEAAGSHQVRWDGRDDQGIRGAAGVYFLRLTAGARRDVGKVILVP